MRCMVTILETVGLDLRPFFFSFIFVTALQSNFLCLCVCSLDLDK